MPVIGPYAGTIAIALVVLVITYLSLVVGELVPKRIALNNPERISSLVAGPMSKLSFITAPFVRLLGVSTDALLRLLRVRTMEEPPVTDKERNDELLSHYHHYFGPHNRIETYGASPPGAPEAISVVEFGPKSSDEVWVYVTLGASSRPMPETGSGDGEQLGYRAECMFYSSNREPAVNDVLANLAIQPFLAGEIYWDEATIPGPPDGLFPGSPLTELLLAKPYFLDEDFDPVLHKDGSHTHILWAIPIYPSERLFVEQHGDLALFDLFMAQEIDSSDLRRPPVV